MPRWCFTAINAVAKDAELVSNISKIFMKLAYKSNVRYCTETYVYCDSVSQNKLMYKI